MKAKNNDKTIYIIGGIILAIVSVIVIGVANPTGNATSKNGELDNFAKCLTEENAIFYGTEWCGFCQQQKEMFDSSMQHINYVDCDENRETCMSEGISGYPTWKIDNQLHSGVQQLTKLSDLTGCEIFA